MIPHCPCKGLRWFNVELGIKSPILNTKADHLMMFKQEAKHYKIRNSLTDNKRLEIEIVSRKVGKWVD